MAGLEADKGRLISTVAELQSALNQLRMHAEGVRSDTCVRYHVG